MGTEPNTILLVDDGSLVANSLARLLRAKGYDVSICPDPKAALVACKKRTFDLIITDQRMPVMYGTEFAQQARKLKPAARIILISGYSDREQVVNAFNMDAINHHVLKPWDNNDLLDVVDEQLQLSFELFWQEQSEEHDSVTESLSANTLLRAS
jgi:DNA-binding NtrC family response regulator